MKRAGSRDALSTLLRALTWIAAIITAGVMILLMVYILIKGVASLTPELFAWKYTSDNCSMVPALLGELVEFGDTEQIFSTPRDRRTEDYITGRFG